jgi:hypothetical protein
MANGHRFTGGAPLSLLSRRPRDHVLVVGTRSSGKFAPLSLLSLPIYGNLSLACRRVGTEGKLALNQFRL